MIVPIYIWVDVYRLANLILLYMYLYIFYIRLVLINDTTSNLSNSLTILHLDYKVRCVFIIDSDCTFLSPWKGSVQEYCLLSYFKQLMWWNNYFYIHFCTHFLHRLHTYYSTHALYNYFVDFSIIISDMHVQNKKYGNFVSISSLTGKCAAQKLKKLLLF